MKKCKKCGCHIKCGENGCAMSDLCFSCKPIDYHSSTKKKDYSFPQMSYDELNYIEGKSVYDW